MVVPVLVLLVAALHVGADGGVPVSSAWTRRGPGRGRRHGRNPGGGALGGAGGGARGARSRVTRRATWCAYGSRRRTARCSGHAERSRRRRGGGGSVRGGRRCGADDRGSATVWAAFAARGAVRGLRGPARARPGRRGPAPGGRGRRPGGARPPRTTRCRAAAAACAAARRVARGPGRPLVRCAVAGEIADVTAEAGPRPVHLAGHGPGAGPAGARPTRRGHRRRHGCRGQGRRPVRHPRQRPPAAPRATARVSSRTAPRLCSGSLPLPHLGDWMQDGQPASHSQAAMASRVAVSQARGGVEGALGEARAAGVAVVDEDRGQQGVRVQRDGDAADVPAVAGGEQRQHADGGVLGGVQGAAEDLRVDPGGVELVLGDRPPHGAGAQRAGRQVELGLAQHLAGDQPAAQEGDDLVGDLDGAEAQPAVAPGDLRCRSPGRRWRWCRGRSWSTAGWPPRPGRPSPPGPACRTR